MVSIFKACNSLWVYILLLSDWPSNSEGRDGILDPRHHGLWLPLELGMSWTPSPGETDPTNLRNREWGSMSVIWDPLWANANGPGKGEGECLPQVIPHIRACILCHHPLSTTSWAGLVRLLYVWTMAMETKIIRVGTMNGIIGKPGDLPGFSPSLGLGMHGVERRRFFSKCLKGSAPKQLACRSGSIKAILLWESGGFALPPAWGGPSDPSLGTGITPAHSTSGTWVHLQLRASS